MARVKREYPGAWWNESRQAIEGYSESLYLGVGQTEPEAWRDAEKNLRRHRT
jgi:hypothetical protein